MVVNPIIETHKEVVEAGSDALVGDVERNYNPLAIGRGIYVCGVVCVFLYNFL